MGNSFCLDQFNYVNVNLITLELEVAIVLGFVGSFMGILGYKVFRIYTISEEKKTKMVSDVQEKEAVIIMKKKLDDAQNLARQQTWKIKKLRNNYDLQFDDDELDEIAVGDDGEFALSDIAKALYPKLPPALGNLLDKEEFQNAILKTVEKKPDLITTFVDKYLNKTEKGSDQGSTNKLTEHYL